MTVILLQGAKNVKRILRLLITVLTICLLLTSCKLPEGPSSGNTDGQSLNTTQGNNDDVMDSGPVKRGLVKLFTTKPDTLNPVLTGNIYVQRMSNLIFESLVKLDKKQKPVPVLAERWDVSSDGLTWTFHLRSNVSWQDKMPLSAQDVKFTVSTILNASSNSVYKKNLENVATFTDVDKNTFRIVLHKPNSFTAELMTFPIIPMHYYVGEDVFNSYRNFMPLGTGPYKFIDYNENSNIKLAINENWWNSKNHEEDTPDLPYIQDVEVRIYENVKDSISSFQTRDIDATVVMQGESSNYNGRTDMAVRKYAGNNYDFIAFNLSKPLLADKTIRQAIAYAIDKSKIIDEIMPGDAIASDLPVIPDTWLYDTNIINYTPSPSKAKELLLQNGWTEDNDILKKRIGWQNVKLQFEMLVNDDNDIRLKVANKISEQLKEAGIILNIRKVKWEDELKLINSRKFDMVLIGSTITSIPDISFMYSSAEIATGRNIAGYNNTNVDNYLNQILTENDENYKKAVFINLKSTINDELPYIGLYFYNNAVLYNKKVRGELEPYLWDPMHDITKWYIPLG